MSTPVDIAREIFKKTVEGTTMDDDAKKIGQDLELAILLARVLGPFDECSEDEPVEPEPLAPISLELLVQLHPKGRLNSYQAYLIAHRHLIGKDPVGGAWHVQDKKAWNELTGQYNKM